MSFESLLGKFVINTSHIAPVVKVELFSYRNVARTVAKIFKKASWEISSKDPQFIFSSLLLPRTKRHFFKQARNPNQTLNYLNTFRKGS